MIKLMLGDCLERMNEIEDKTVDMILCDLPYGTTANEWDEIIPFEPLWQQYKRVLRHGGIVALFAQTPFDKILGASNLKWLKYEWIWSKNKATGFLNANKAPLKAHENILIFCENISNIDTTDMFNGLKDYMISERNKTGLGRKELKELLDSHMASHYFTRASQFTIPSADAYARLQTTGYFKRHYEEIQAEYKRELSGLGKINIYNPQGIKKIEKPVKIPKRVSSENYRTFEKEYIQQYENYPRDILEFDSVMKTEHPTQKPVNLLEYLIKTYSNENDIILDNCMGSGSTGVACVNTNRQFIGIEKEEKYFEIAKRRIEGA